ncbi:MAG: UDP-N-acetylglucosamine--N-acetylmuramyl-(pentapeptide) pyrophosphoryl-undecaprenol N-acetylglucosamine transferase [Candidatus Kapaibacterium sp.]|nr:MAG: UDP-N-acetylglucosamine--N-acetylmuramyl-(pentapeptide) pyrophosphoryl-undecaprenol N-acetylglucosamine transferase [Candidatus Kapabacteria bacterium]
MMKILLSAGGTGGHLFPAISVIEQIQEILGNSEHIEVYAVGNPQKIEARVAKERNWKFVPIPMEGFAGFGLKFFKFFFKTIQSINIIRNLIRKENIDFGIGTGAYLTYPAGIALHSEGKPFFLLESNLVPGKANRLLARRASLFFATFENTHQYLPPSVESKIRVYGTPIRKDLLTKVTKEEARQKLNIHPDRQTILVFGGSLGARTINQGIYQNYSMLIERGYQLVWQIGKNFEIEKVSNPFVKIYEFIDDMATAYASADIVIARAGASTIAEISALGKPAILLPYPYATDNHQLLNARELESHNAAIVVLDEEANSKLVPKIIELLESPSKQEQLSKNIIKFSRPDAGFRIAKEILNFLNI